MSSPYLPVELDAINRFPLVAAAAGLPVEKVSHGCLQLWSFCFRADTDRVTPVHIRGFFGADISEALEAFGFVQRDNQSTPMRVCGAEEKLLRQKRARSKGGHAAKGNLRRGTDPALPLPPAGATAGEQPESSRGAAGKVAPAPPGSTPNTQHPTPLKDPPAPGTLRDRLETVFERVKGHAYRWRSADDNACRELLALCGDDWADAERRFEVGLKRLRYPTCNGVLDLVKHWNAYAASEPPPASGFERPRPPTTPKAQPPTGPCTSCRNPADCEVWGKPYCYGCASSAPEAAP